MHSKKPAPLRWNITATLLEDTHLGSGIGGGGIDALIARDREGRPVIWASHLEGLLRSAAATLLNDKAVEQLFGARGGLRQRTIFTSLYATTTPETHIWRASARASFDNRAAKDDTLQVREYIPQKTVFVGAAELDPSDAEIFDRLFQEVFAVGQGRAGGAGRIRFSHTNQAQPATAPMADHHMPPTLNTPSRLLLLLQNIEPVCIAATGIPDNMIPTAAYIPGRTLQGSVAAWLFADGYAHLAQQLVEGMVKVSDALPLPQSAQNIKTIPLSSLSVLPAPLALKHEKPTASGKILPWWAENDTDVQRFDGLKNPNKLPLKRPSAQLFIYRAEGEAWQAYEPTLRVRLRNDYTEAQLFSIEQIVEKTLFFAELSGDADVLKALSAALQPVFNHQRWLRIGRSGAAVEIRRSEWAAPRVSSPVISKGYLTLTSDLLARDSNLRWITTITPENMTDIAQWPQHIQLINAAQEPTTVHGFNGTSRLRRLPAMAIRRGSVFLLEGQGLEQLSQMAAEGRWLGERTQEGFGQFRIDQELPGISASSPQAIKENTQIWEPGLEESIAKQTYDWAQSYDEQDPSDLQKPSLTQWQNFLVDYQGNAEAAIATRAEPVTRGKMCWEHPHAQKILSHLTEHEIRASGQASAYLHYFVRWIRAFETKKAAKA